jgi:hypothetical protein
MPAGSRKGELGSEYEERPEQDGGLRLMGVFPPSYPGRHSLCLRILLMFFSITTFASLQDGRHQCIAADSAHETNTTLRQTLPCKQNMHHDRLVPVRPLAY